MPPTAQTCSCGTHNRLVRFTVCGRVYGDFGITKTLPSFQNSTHWCANNALAQTCFTLIVATKVDVAADVFSNEVRVLMEEHAGDNKRLAVDKIMLHGLRALEAQGFENYGRRKVTEKSRSIKGPDEILAMRCASVACENAVAEMERITRRDVPLGNMSRTPFGRAARRKLVKRGGEWIETRLLASGPRTNPWFQECGPRIVQNNEIVAFDTDLVGSYGICVDISRTWWVGDQRRAPIWYMRCNT